MIQVAQENDSRAHEFTSAKHVPCFPQIAIILIDWELLKRSPTKQEMMLFRPTEDVAECDQCNVGIDEFVNSMYATTGAEVVGDSFATSAPPHECSCASCEARWLPPGSELNSSFVWTYQKSRANGSLEMYFPLQCELRKFSPISLC